MTTAPRKPLFSSNYQFDMLVCLGLVLAVFVPYHQVAGHRFIEYDDGLYTYYNIEIMRGLSWDSVSWAFTNTEAANWHPLTWISHLVDRELFGPHPGGYLLENVAWHALASCLCYLAFFKTTRSRLFALSIALIFAVHPANVENVAWASERKSLLNAVFWFCAIIAYLDFVETRSFRAYGITTIAYLLSLLSKAMSVTLPGTLVLIHVLYLVYHPDRRPTVFGLRQYLKKLLLPVLPLFGLSVYFAAVTMSAQTGAVMSAGYPFGLRLVNVILSYERYLRMFFHPTELAIFYPLFPKDITIAQAVPGILILFAISALVLLLVRKKPQLLIGWCWFLGTMVPVIGLVQVGAQSHADRYLYIPMLGLAFVLPALFEELRTMGVPLRRTVIGTSLAGLAVSLIFATQIQVSYWKDGVTLFRHSLAVTGDCVTPVINLTTAFVREGHYEEAIAFADAKIAVAQNPVNKGKLSAMKAAALYNMQKRTEAADCAQQALGWGNTDPLNYFILAVSAYESGLISKSDQYVAQARAALKTSFQSSFIDKRLGEQIRQLENELKAKAPPKAGSIQSNPGLTRGSIDR